MPNPKKGLTRLHSLDAKEVSLVPEGANRRNFLIFKSAEGNKKMPQMSPAEKLHKMISKTNPEIMKKVEGMLSNHFASKKPEGHQAPPPPAKKPEMAPQVQKDEGMDDEMSSQAQTALKAVVRILSPFKEKLSPVLVHEILEAAGFQLGSEESGDEDPDEDEMSKMDGGEEEEEDAEKSVEGQSDVEHEGGEEEEELESGINGDNEGHEGRPGDEEAHKSALDEKAEDEEDEEQEGHDMPGADNVGLGGQKKEAGFKAIPEKIEGIEKEHMMAAKEMAKKVYKEHLEKLGYRKYPDAEMAMKNMDGKPVSKKKGESVAKQFNASNLVGLQPKARRELESIFKSNQELVRKNADLETRIKAGEAKAREKEIVAKAATFAHVALPQEEIIETLKDADRLGAKSFERVCKSFAALNEQGRTSKLFGEFGSNLPNTGSSPDDVWARIEKAAQGMVAKSATGKDLSQSEKTELFLKTDEGQKMYAEYKSGRKDGI